MRELEKILEEIEELRGQVGSECTSEDHYMKKAWEYCLDLIEEVIRKHMNDGWIPVDDRLPEKNEYFADTSSDREFPNGYYRRLEIAYMTDTVEYIHGYYDGYKWMDKYLDTITNVVAWRIHEPYRPKRSEE